MKIKLLTSHTDSSIGLRLAGVDAILVRTAEDARLSLDKLCCEEDLGLLLITSEMEDYCAEQLGELRRKGKPIIVCVPDSVSGFKESTAIGDYIKNAIGIKID